MQLFLLTKCLKKKKGGGQKKCIKDFFSDMLNSPNYI